MISVEKILNTPPRGPARWGWVQKAMTAIARGARVISPDQSVEITPTPSGVTLRRVAASDGDGPGYAPFSFAPVGSGVPDLFAITGGDIDIHGSIYTVDDVPALFWSRAVPYLVVRVPLALTVLGSAVARRFREGFIWIDEIDIDATDPDGIVVKTMLPFDIENESYVAPGAVDGDFGAVIIPIGYYGADGPRAWWTGSIGIRLQLNRTDFEINQDT